MDSRAAVCRVLLIDPPAPDLGINLGLGYLAACLGKAGHPVKVLDLNNVQRGGGRTAVAQALATFKPDLVGVSATSPVYREALRVARDVKESGFAGPLVFGGVHANLNKAKVLEDGVWDMVVFGEGEYTIVEIADGAPKPSIKGLAWRDDAGAVHENGPRPFIADLDELPFPDFTVFGLKKIGWYPIMTSRGCPFECGFCMSPTIWSRKWRERSADSVIAELEHARRTYAIEGFNMRDDNFSIKMGRAKEICRRLRDAPAKIPWTCNNGVYARLIDDELAKLMAEAGCVQVSLGVESLVESVFDLVNKGEKLEHIYQAANRFRANGIRVRGFMILGLPGDTYQTTMESFRRANELGLDEYGWNTFLPFPFTPGGDWVRSHGRIFNDDPWAMKHGDLVFDTPEFPLAEREKAWHTIAMKTHQYGSLYDHDTSPLRNLRRILGLVWKYDRARLPQHVLQIGRRYLRSRERSPG
jgi:anaerobic magnesium-protoporphyrin IX monomethyl ester cyclase